MSFRKTVETVAERLAARPVFSRHTFEERIVDGETVRIPRVEDLEPDENNRRKARRKFRAPLNETLSQLSQSEVFKLSVLVRAVRSGGGSILDMARDTRAKDRTASHARHEEIVAGLALAEKQGVDLDATWGKS